MSDIEEQSSHSDEESDNDYIDLDAFLTSIESKLRGPFSSLELTKTISTPALRVGTITSLSSSHTSNSKPCSAGQYLHRISRVLSRTDKLTQLRILIALLGLETQENESTRASNMDDGEDEKMEAQVLHLLKQAQTAPTYDQWVRIVSGLVQNRVTSSCEPAQSDSPQTAGMGAEAKKVLDKTCKSILQRVNSRIRQTEQYDADSDDEDTDIARKYLAATADADPLLAPFYYALLSPTILKQVLPEATAPQQHFQLNETAEILLMDAKLEQQKALDEQTHGTASATTAGASIVKANAVAAKAQTNTGAPRPSGPAPTTAAAGSTISATAASRPKQPAVKKKSSLFIMSTKPMARPGMTTAATRQPTAGGASMRAQPVLHTRKAGAAQSLLRTKKNGLQRMNLASSASGLAAATGASAQTAGAAKSLAAERHPHQRSKMKMMDVAEVQDQFQKHQQQANETLPVGMQNKKKRKADASAELNGSDKPRAAKVLKGGEAPVSDPAKGSTAGEGAAAAAAALSAYQAKVTSVTTGNGESTHAATHVKESLARHDSDPSHTGHPNHHRQQDWRQMLQEKSNRLTPDDRLCVEQFFQRSFDQQRKPTGMVKLKLHEERLSDPDRKETYYLELDYDNLTSKQSKKVKRY
jgi:hypothetical protein